MAMKPDCLPMSLTTEMPPLLRASTRAEMSERCASSTAVSKPKQRSICGRGRGRGWGVDVARQANQQPQGRRAPYRPTTRPSNPPSHPPTAPSTRPTHQLDVVVNGLRDTHHVAHHALRCALFGNRVRRRVAAVAANHVAAAGAAGRRWAQRREHACLAPAAAPRAETSRAEQAGGPHAQLIDAPEAQPLHDGRHLGIAARRALQHAGAGMGARAGVQVGVQPRALPTCAGTALPCPSSAPCPAPLAQLPRSRSRPRHPRTSTVPPLSWMPSTADLDSCTGLA